MVTTRSPCCPRGRSCSGGRPFLSCGWLVSYPLQSIRRWVSCPGGSRSISGGIPGLSMALGFDEVEVILKCGWSAVGLAGRACHIHLEDRDRLVPHRCCEGVVLGQLPSAVLVCWVAHPEVADIAGRLFSHSPALLQSDCLGLLSSWLDYGTVCGSVVGDASAMTICGPRRRFHVRGADGDLGGVVSVRWYLC